MRLFRFKNRHARTCVYFTSFFDTSGLSFHQKSAQNRSFFEYDQIFSVITRPHDILRQIRSSLIKHLNSQQVLLYSEIIKNHISIPLLYFAARVFTSRLFSARVFGSRPGPEFRAGLGFFPVPAKFTPEILLMQNFLIRKPQLDPQTWPSNLILNLTLTLTLTLNLTWPWL